MIEKKLAWSCDIVFIKDQTINNIEKVEKKVSSGSEGVEPPLECPSQAEEPEREPTRGKENIIETTLICHACL